MLTAYFIGAGLMLVALIALRLRDTDGDRSAVIDTGVILAATALWPLTLLVQVVMVLLFIRDMRNWPQ